MMDLTCGGALATQQRYRRARMQSRLESMLEGMGIRARCNGIGEDTAARNCSAYLGAHEAINGTVLTDSELDAALDAFAFGYHGEMTTC